MVGSEIISLKKHYVYVGLGLFMLIPAVNVFDLWPMPSALADGLSILVTGLIFGSTLMISSDRQFKISPLLAACALFFAIVCGSLFINTYEIEASWRWYVIFLTYSMVVLLGVSEIIGAEGADRYYQTIISTLWLGALVYTVLSLCRYYGILQVFFPWLEASTGRMGGMWGQPNLTNTTVWLGLLAAIVRFDWRVNPYKLGSCVFLFGWVIACAASRMSWLFAVGLLLLVGVSSLPNLRTPEAKRVRIGLVLSIAAVVVMIFLVPLANEPLGRWLTDKGVVNRAVSVSLDSRDVSSDAARLSEFSKLKSSVYGWSLPTLFFGVGPGRYANFSANADLELAPDDLTPTIWLHSHNIFSMIFVELGLTGLLVLIVFVLMIGWQLLRKPITPHSFLSAGALGLLFIHSNLEFPLWYPWFLFLAFMLVAPIFPVWAVRSDVSFLKPAVGLVIMLMTVALIVNVGSQYRTIAEVAMNPEPDENDYNSLGYLANDSLMGPYAILRRYYDFAPAASNLEWQLREVRRVKAWQSRDLVMMREFSLLALQGNVGAACSVARQTAYRYPQSAPIMLEHAMLAKNLKPDEVVKLAECIETGLEPRGETIPSMEQKNNRTLN